MNIGTEQVGLKLMIYLQQEVLRDKVEQQPQQL
jgi:hypothetical protein